MSRAVKLASALYASSILLSRVIGLVREGVIGRVLGDSGQADVYWVAFILPDFLNYLLAGGALSLVLIPLLQSANARGGDAEAWACFWRVITPISLFALIVTGAGWLSVTHLSQTLAPGFNAQQLETLERLTRIILPAQLFHLTGAALSAKLQAHDRHLAPALAPLLYTGSVALSGLLFGAQLGAEAFAWGVLVGSALGPFACPLLALSLTGAGGRLSGRPRWEPRHEEVRAYLWRALPVMLGFSIVALDELIMKRFGTDLGEGAVAQLHYARTLMRVPMGVFGLALGMATFPTLSRYCAEGAPRRALNLLTRSLKALLLLASLSEVALTACSAELAALIWGRARITDLGLASIGLYCSAMSVGLWAWAAHGLVARGFYARGQTWRPTLLGSVVTLCAVPLYLTAARKGALALCFASSTAISVYVASLWWWVRASLLSAPSELNLSEEEPVEPLAVELLKVACVTLVGVGVALALDHHLGGVTGWGEGSVGLVWSGALKLCGALSASLTLAFVFKVEVLGELKARLSDKLTRR